jgi:hypothetical protein
MKKGIKISIAALSVILLLLVSAGKITSSGVMFFSADNSKSLLVNVEYAKRTEEAVQMESSSYFTIFKFISNYLPFKKAE